MSLVVLGPRRVLKAREAIGDEKAQPCRCWDSQYVARDGEHVEKRMAAFVIRLLERARLEAKSRNVETVEFVCNDCARELAESFAQLLGCTLTQRAES